MATMSAHNGGGGGPPPEIRELITHLGNVQCPDMDKLHAARKYLEHNGRQENFPSIVLKLLTQSQISEDVRISGAIFLKNLFKKYYALEEAILAVSDTKLIKEKIVNLMLASPKLIQSQLCETITIIAKKDFYQGWPDLLPSLVAKLRSDNFHSHVGVLTIIKAITGRYSQPNLFGGEKTSSDKPIRMVREIEYVVKTFGETWLNAMKLWQAHVLRVFVNPKISRDEVQRLIGDRAGFDRLKLQTECLVFLVDIFSDLIAVDWIAFFDDCSAKWMEMMRQMIQCVDTHCVFGKSNETPSPLDNLLTSVAKALRILVDRYDEEIQRHVAPFVGLVGQLVSRIDTSSRFDPLVSESIHFLTCVSRQRWHAHLFSDTLRLNNIVKHILVRNIRLRDSDISLYEMNGDQWVLKDMEGSDLYTRRRGAIDLVRGLSTSHEKAVADIIANYLRPLTTNYKANPAQNYRDLDAAINLILAISVKASTRALGATKLNTNIPVFKFFHEFILPELRSKSKAHDIIRADALKFVVIFRSQWKSDEFKSLLPMACAYLREENYVLHTYAAIAIDKILSLRHVDDLNSVTFGHSIKSTKKPYKYSKADLEKNLKNVCVSLFHVLINYEESECNEYVMRAILRVIQRAEGGIIKVIPELVGSLNQILVRQAKNPKKPQFNHYLFESIAASIYFCCKDVANARQVEKFEQSLMPTFIDKILDKETCIEFYPYVYQIIGLMLRLRDKITDQYRSLFDKLLRPMLWRDQGTILAISGLLSEYLEKIPNVSTFLDKNKLEGMLGIFQHLLKRKIHDVHAFKILNSLFEHVPHSVMGQYLPQILQLVFERLATKKSKNLCCNFLVALSMYLIKNGLNAILDAANRVQKDIWGMIIQKIWFEYARKVTSLYDRQILVIGTVNMIFTDTFLNSSEFNRHIPRLICLIIEIFEINPLKDEVNYDERRQIRLERLEAQGFGAKFSGLAYVMKKKDSKKNLKRLGCFDEGERNTDLRLYLIRRVSAVCAKNRSIRENLSRGLEKKYLQVFNAYCEQFRADFRL